MTKKKGKKLRYVVLVILLALIIGGAVVVESNWDLIQAIRIGSTSDLSAIQSKQLEKDKALEASLGIDGNVSEDMVSNAQNDIEEFLASGKSIDQLVESVLTTGGSTGGSLGQGGESSNTSNQGGASQGGQTQGNAVENGSGGNIGVNKTDIVTTYTTRLYALRNVFQGKLDSLVADAKAEYAALPEDQRTGSSKRSIMYSKMDEAEALEAQCDSMVDAYLAQMEADLKAAGESTAPINELRSYYEEAKINQKAAYLAKARGSE